MEQKHDSLRDDDKGLLSLPLALDIQQNCPYPAVKVTAAGTIRYFNKAAQPLVQQWQKDQLLRLPEQLQSLLKKALQTGQAHKSDLQFGGKYYDITAVQGSDKRFVDMYLVDLTSRLKKLRQTEHETHNLQLILDAVRDGLCIIDKDLQIKYTNAAMEQICGQVGNSKCYQYFYGRSSVCPWCRKDEVFGGKTIHFEWTPPDSERVYEILDTPIVDDNGQTAKLEIVREITERKQKETQLKASESKLWDVFDHCPVAVAISTRDTGIFLEVNDAFCQLTGYARDEVVGNSSLELDLWKDHNQRQTVVDIVSRTGSARGVEVDAKTRTGETRTVLFGAEPIVMEGRECLITIAEDISSRKQSERQLIESEERFRTLVQTMSEGLGHLDQNDHIIYINQQFCDMLKYQKEQLLGRHILQFVDAQSLNVVQNSLKWLRKGESRPIEIIWRRADGTKIITMVCPRAVYNEKGRYIGSIGVATNISPRLEAERKLQNYLSVLEATLDSTADGILVVSRQGKVTNYNNKFIHMWNVPDELLKRSQSAPLLDHMCTQVEDSEAFRKNAIQTFGDEQTYRSDTFELKDGRVLEIYSQPHRINGTTVGRVWSFSDLTDMVRFQKEREHLLKMLESKNRELQSIVYTASHDLRAPLVSVLGFAEETRHVIERLRSDILESGIPENQASTLEEMLDSELSEDLQYIIAGAEKIENLLAGLLRVSRVGNYEPNFRTIEMNSLIDAVVRSIKYQIDARQVELCIEPLPNCLGDSRQINQIFSNLLDNAVKYLDDTRPGQIAIKGWIENGKAVYSITDNGIGIADKNKEAIFEIFQREHDKTNVAGEGLGLTIVRRIIDRHDGNIWVESEKGEGSTFYITLPLA